MGVSLIIKQDFTKQGAVMSPVRCRNALLERSDCCVEFSNAVNQRCGLHGIGAATHFCATGSVSHCNRGSVSGGVI